MKTQSGLSRLSALQKTSTVYMLTKTPKPRYPYYPPVTILPAECEVLYTDQKSGEQYMRLARYTKGMPSIWVDEWPDKQQDRKAERIKFKIGYLTVSNSDTNLKKFMDIAGYNEKNNDTRHPMNGVLFKEVDTEGESKEILNKDALKVKAMNFVLDAPLEDVRTIALSMAGSKAETEAIYSMDEFTLRFSIKGIAQNSPEKLLGEIKSDVAKNKISIIKAAKAGIIEVSEERGLIEWKKTGEAMIQGPEGIDIITHFAEIAVSNTKYKMLLEAIDERLSSTGNLEHKEESVENLSWQEKLIEEALTSERLVDLGGNWYAVPGDDDDDEPKVKFHGKKKLKEAITKNEDDIMSMIAG
jgi:hypothetical protein